MADIKLYTIPRCGFCMRARRLLDQKGVAYVEFDVSGNAEAMAAIRAVAPSHTFPQIVIHDVAIGGSEELFTLDRDGRLDAMIY
jgi:glutaredoxin 3